MELTGSVSWFPEGQGDSITSNLAGESATLSVDTIGFKGIIIHFGLTCGYIF
jgi:hypothetical protein